MTERVGQVEGANRLVIEFYGVKTKDAIATFRISLP